MLTSGIKIKAILLIFCVISINSVRSQNLYTKAQLDTCRVFSNINDALKCPEQVIVLDLSGSQLSKLPVEINKYANLQRLNLANNNLSELPIQLFELNSLQELNLEENKLNALPPEIGKLINLKRLNLTRTKIPALPVEMGNLSKLEFLDLSWNDLKKEDIENIFGLQKLKSLNLQRNSIDSLSTGIEKLTNLQILNLRFNPLKFLPGEIGKLSRLRELDLGKNTELETLPGSFKNLVNLEYLNLEGVSLSDEEKQKLPEIDAENIEF